MINLNEVTADTVYKDGINQTLIVLDAKRLAHDNNLKLLKHPFEGDSMTYRIPLRELEDPYFAFSKAVATMGIRGVYSAQTYYVVSPNRNIVLTMSARITK